MFLAYLMTFGSFILFYYVTVVIFNNLKERDAHDLAALDSQLKSLTQSNPELMKQVI